MSRRRQIPKLVHHKPSGQARLRINGQDFYCGVWGTPDAEDRYDKLVKEKVLDAPDPVSASSLTAVLSAWWDECKRRYTRGKGKLGGAQNWRILIRILRTNHGDERAEDLGPVKLRKLLEREAKNRDWSLRYTKMMLARTKQVYKWAAAEELVSINAYQRLQVVELRHGRATKPIEPIDDQTVHRTLPFLSRKVADMIRLQRLTGMRPGELVIMRPDDVDRTADVWTYTPEFHKTEHRGKSRTIYLGPKAQAVLAKWLVKADGFVFPTRRSKHYSTDSYRRAIQRACERRHDRKSALWSKRYPDRPYPRTLVKWSPNQLRKAAATSIRAALNVEAAASVLGHSSSQVTQDHYAVADKKRALEAVRLLG